MRFPWMREAGQIGDSNFRAAVAFVDEKFGEDWATKIDVDGLDMLDPEHCILGQLSSGRFSLYIVQYARARGFGYRIGLDSYPFSSPSTKRWWVAEIRKRVTA